MSTSEIVPGQYIDEYRLLRRLGQGNNSEVYLGEHPRLDHPVAVKLLYARTEEREIQRFLTQSAMLSKLDHPHIIHIYNFGLTYSGTPYLVMSYAPQGTLRQRYPRGTRLPLPQVGNYVNQLADALQYVHEHQLVHRDVKPQNMLLDSEGQIILNDFGTAITSYSLIPNVVDFEGTVLYAAPEQLEGRSLRSSDQYALAIMTYELLCGAWPFIGTFDEVTRKHLFEQPPTLFSRGIEVAPGVDEVLQRALAKEPVERFPSIQDFAIALTETYMPAATPGPQGQFPQQEPQTPLPVSQVSPLIRKQFRSPLPFRQAFGE